MEKYNYYLDINFKDRTSEVEALYEPTLKDIKADPEMYAELVNDLLFHWVYGTRETPLMVMVKKQMQGDTKMADGGVMAMGGILEHGLKIGDEIIDVSDINSSSIRVMNDGKYAYVNLSTGVRKEAMALGGLFGDSRYNYGRSWTLDHRQHNKEESYETPLKNRKRKYYDGGDIDMAKGGVPRQRKYDNGGMMAKGGYDDFGYHKVNKEVTLKNGEKIYITKGRYYWSNELGDGRVSGIYYESKDGLISQDSIDKMADGGVMAMGGILEHGLKIGDEIIDVSDINSSSIRVMNDGKYAYVNLSTGERKEAMALGGLFGDSRYNYGRSWTLDHRQHNKGESYETPLKNRKRKYYDGGDIDIYGNKVEFPLSNHQMKNYVIDKTGISSGTYINGKYYDTWDKIATDLGFMREENGWVKAFPSRIYTRKRKY